MNKKELIGKTFNLDLGALAPVSVTVREVKTNNVVVEYNNVIHGRTREISLKAFEHFAAIKINENE
jgi:FKBP-type peptidyl-prolyl cis-trans isomerase 2